MPASIQTWGAREGVGGRGGCQGGAQHSPPSCPPRHPHLRLGQLGPVRFQVVDDAAQRPGQRHPMDQQQDEDHVREECREVDNLQRSGCR